MLIIGHRGCAGLAPENTLAAIRKALSLTDMIEVDVRTCRTGEPVLFHDESLERLTGMRAKVAETGLSELKRLSVQGEQIPTLEEALRTIGRKVPVNLEIKDWNSIEAVKRLVQKYCDVEETLMSSADRTNILRLDQMFAARIGIVTLGINPFIIKWMGRHGIYSASVMYPFIRRGFVEGCSRRGMKVYAYPHGAKSRMDYGKLERVKVDGAFFNYPGKKSF